jgi:hypothetical protein
MSFPKHGSRILSDLRTYRVPPELTPGAILDYLEALNCPRSLTVAILFRNEEFGQLVKLECDPLMYLKPHEFRDAYAATKFLSKYRDFSLDYDVKEVAMQKFLEFELLCKQTNARFRHLSADPKYKGHAVWLHNAVIRKVERILGELDLQELFSFANWGPGATTLIKARDSSSTNKFQCETGITRDLYDLIPSSVLTGEYPLWFTHILSSGNYPTFQVGNKVVTVPKDATTDRVIAIEPGINLWFQKAIGSMMRQRLLRFGIDLRYQSRNQRLAWSGSKTQTLATIDFSSASDSISSEVVRSILPAPWHFLLDKCRSQYGVLDGVPTRWHKFSSMGNAFTFELETLIFFAIASSCMEYLQLSSTEDSCISVYGDDVIIPITCLELFAEMSDFYGFTVNRKKSHYDSTFRESCGSHYNSGVDVTPIYLKDKLSDVPSVFRLANAIRRLAHRRNSHYGCDSSFRAVFDTLVHGVPKLCRLRIPSTLGDGGFISNWDEASPVRLKHGVEGYRVKNVMEVGKTYKSDQVGLLLSQLWKSAQSEEQNSPLQNHHDLPSAIRLAHQRSFVRRLRGLLSSGTGNSVPLRDRVKLKVVGSHVSQWYDLGPWL